jgi:hypothetical protein
MKNTKETIEKAVSGTLENLASQGIVNQSKVDSVQTEHEKKNRWGRFKDWVTWRTFAKRWLVKPFWVQVPLTEVLENIRDYGDPRTAKRITDELLHELRGVLVWEKRWPSNPYEVMVVDYTIAPVIPLEYIKMTVELGDDRSA